jgi:plastocyanin
VYLVVLIMMCISMAMIGPSVFAETPIPRISVTATDFKFLPHTWTLDSGQKVSLTFINKGVQEHEWVVLKQGVEIVLPFDNDDEDKVYWEIEAGSGATKEEMFSAPIQPGIYTIVCGKPRHIERGMKATLVVK